MQQQGEVFRVIYPEGSQEEGKPGSFQDGSDEIIGAAIEVHRTLGPGLLESAYEECLCREISLQRGRFQRQIDVPVIYKGVRLDCGYRIDLLVNDMVIVEIKSVEQLLPIHEAQLLT